MTTAPVTDAPPSTDAVEPAAMAGDLLPAAPPPTPAQQLRNDLTDGALAAARAVGLQAWLETLMRTEPRTFVQVLRIVLPDERPVASSPNVVNVINAIPRSPLDALPDGFRVK